MGILPGPEDPTRNQSENTVSGLEPEPENFTLLGLLMEDPRVAGSGPEPTPDPIGYFWNRKY